MAGSGKGRRERAGHGLPAVRVVDREGRVVDDGFGRSLPRGRDWNPEYWAGRRAGRWGTVPRWSWQGGPGRKAEEWAQERGPGSVLVVGHVRSVWEQVWSAVSLGKAGVCDPWVFGEQVARHALGCEVCSSVEGETVWSRVFGAVGLNDVLRLLVKYGPKPAAKPDE